jgi:hypothetical protein
MKKSRKLTGSLLSCCALLMVAIAGLGVTLAKYTKSAEPRNDSAHVAAFGVNLTWSSNESVFKKQYAVEDSSVTDVSVAVKSSSEVIAPGTSGSVTLTLSGTSEVAFKLDISIVEAYSDNWKESASGPVYHPITYSVNSTAKAGDEAINLASDGSFSANIGADVALSGTIVITWTWPFETTGKDLADTYMSGLAASATYSITATASATQIN